MNIAELEKERDTLPKFPQSFTWLLKPAKIY